MNCEMKTNKNEVNMREQANLFSYYSRGYEQEMAFRLSFCKKIYRDSRIRRSEKPVVEARI
jgi:hypothetical protein